MAAATVTSAASNRVAGGMPNISLVPLVVTGVATVYAQGAGNGLPFDITGVLNAVAPPEQFNINPADVIGMLAWDATGNYALTGSLIVGGTAGTITYNTITNASMSVQSSNSTLSACPCLVRIFTNNNAELANGAYSGVLTGFLVVQRGGKN